MVVVREVRLGVFFLLVDVFWENTFPSRACWVGWVATGSQCGWASESGRVGWVGWVAAGARR